MVMFHSSQPPLYHFVKVTTPNPKFVDGVWVSREDDIEGTLYVPPNKGKRFETLFKEHAIGMGVTGPIEFVL